MALTRKMLKAMSIEDEKIDEIISAHSETVDALKDERDGFKAEAEKVKDLESKLTEAQAQLDSKADDAYKVKYEALREEFDSYKADITTKETAAAKSKAYEQLLKDTGISEKRIASVMKVSDLSKIELDKDGKIKDASDLAANIKTEWADFIPTTQTKGAEVSTPPANNAGRSFTTEEIKGMTTAQINANWDSIKASLNQK